MYPFIRLGWQLWRHRRDPPMALTDTHVSHHICWPWDLDMWIELNNGRTLTLYDLGRMTMAPRIGLTAALRRNGWAMAIVGGSIRYRRRVRFLDRVVMKSRAICWDDRFIYTEQSMWKSDGACASHVLLRSAITGKGGIVPPAQVIAALGADPASPPMPGWVAKWVAADGLRPWPPMQDA